jgi:hypothetical protein
VYAALFAVWQAEPVPFEVYAASVMLWAICLFPLAHWNQRGRQTLPMFELICLAYGLQFSMPVFLQASVISTVRGVLLVRWNAVFEAVLLAVLGVAALILGYFLVQRWRLVKLLPRLDLPLRQERRPLYIGLALSLGALALYIQISGDVQIDSTLSASIGVAANQFRLGLALLAYYVYGTSQRRVAPTITFYIILAVAVSLGLISGLLENALLPLVLVALIRWQVKGGLPLWLIVIGFAGFVVLNAVKGEYRSQAWYGGEQLGVTERLSLWSDLGQEVVSTMASGDAASNIVDLVRASMARFDLIHKFGYVREVTPRLIPYYDGATYEYLLIGWIPRFFWPDKPNASSSNSQLDVEYGFLYEQQTSRTVVSIGQLPEAYVNFGLLGVVVVMLLQGLVLGAINHLYNGPRSDGGRAIYLSVMIFFLNGIGSSTVIWFGGLAQNLLANTLILRVFSHSYQGESSALADGEPRKWQAR